MILLSFQILNTKVIFNAKKTEGDSDVTDLLTFNQVDINVGASGCTVSDLSVFGSVRFSNFGFGSVRFFD